MRRLTEEMRRLTEEVRSLTEKPTKNVKSHRNREKEGFPFYQNFAETSWNFVELRWNFVGTSWNFMGISWNFVELRLFSFFSLLLSFFSPLLSFFSLLLSFFSLALISSLILLSCPDSFYLSSVSFHFRQQKPSECVVCCVGDQKKVCFCLCLPLSA